MADLDASLELWGAGHPEAIEALELLAELDEDRASDLRARAVTLRAGL